MKTFTSTIVLLLLASMSIAQNYAPFSETSSKRFFEAGNTSENDFFFHATSSSISGDSTIFNQYYTKQNDGIPGEMPNGCIFWGGTTDERLDTTWLGNQLNWNSTTHELLLQNEAGQAIVFDFNLDLGSSGMFYTNGTTNYFIEHTATNLENFLGVSDSVQVYTINAFDIGGSQVSSALNNFEIRLSKNHGLISFINCYEFPALEQGMEIQGQTNPLLGSYQLTFNDSYPWQAGDVLQYYNYSSPQQPYTKYTYHTMNVTDRTETADSVFISFTNLVQDLPYIGPPVPSYTVSQDQIRFKKNTPIWIQPWNKAITEGVMNYLGKAATEEYNVECSTNRQFVTRESFTLYCDSCRCFGQADGFGSSIESRFYTENLGIFRQSAMSYGSATPGVVAELVYWNVNGEECGTFWNSQDELFQFEISIAPNPTKDVVKIESDQQIETIRVLDLSGRVLFSEQNVNLKLSEISLASFQKGAYILEVSANGSTQKRTIIRE